MSGKRLEQAALLDEEEDEEEEEEDIVDQVRGRNKVIYSILPSL